ncbi:CU044_5270 family protein [Spirillospora sp. NPDC047279]|uniref:CU044_5270 family protein n=1 Tax=Spirillospora sp. NPDC047279 TaxID=3155478 RepID=UPI003408A6B4
MTRDVMRALAEARPEEFGAAVDEATREAEIARAMSASPRRTAVPARRRIRPMWGLGLVGAAAAAALVVATAGTGPGDGGGTGDDGPTAGGSPSVQAPVALNARTVLLAAAERADGEPLASGAYWRVATTSRLYYQVGTPANGYTIVVTTRGEGWTPAKPRHKSYGSEQYLGARPATAADTAAWRRAGSPASFEVEVPIAPGSKIRKPPTKLAAAPGKPQVNGSDLVDGDKVFWLGRNVTMKDLARLPSEPGALRTQLLRWYNGHSTESSSEPMGSDEWLFQVTRGLITDMPVTPKVRAGAFRMLAQLKSIKAVGPVVDGEGRTGTALVMTERTGNGVLEHRVIVDEGAGRALGNETVIVKPAGMNAHLPAGSKVSSSTITEAAWTNTAPR